MTVKLIGEALDERTAEQTFQGTRYTRTFKLLTTDPSDDAYHVRMHPDLPHIGDSYPEDSLSIVSRVIADPLADDGTKWLVRVEYGYLDARDVQMQQNPLMRPPRVRWGQVTEKEEVTVDLYGRPIVNSAGVAFNNVVLERDVSRPTLVVVQNQQTFSVNQANTFVNTVNNDIWWYDANYSLRGQAKVKSITGEKFYEAGMACWTVTYEFHFKGDGWNSIQVRDMGRTAIALVLPPGGSKKQLVWQKATDEYGNEVAEDVPLNGAGGWLEPNEDGVFDYVYLSKQPDPDPDPDGPKGYVRYHEMDFTLLDLR